MAKRQHFCYMEKGRLVIKTYKNEGFLSCQGLKFTVNAIDKRVARVIAEGIISYEKQREKRQNA